MTLVDSNETGRDRRVSAGAACLALAGFVAWVSTFGYRLASVPVTWWRWRDDAVITLSHSQNLIRFGTIGVSPGDRVEAFSSPLQFLLSSLFFWITKAGYEWYLDAQVWICLGSAGTFLALASFRILGSIRRSFLLRLLGAFLLSLLAACLTASSWTATGWLASGMENPLAMTLGAALVYALTLKPSLKRLIVAGFLVGFLGIVRVEFPVFMLPLSAAVCMFCWLESREHRVLKTAAWSFGIPILIWLIVNVSRLVYFGDLLPNTALVQDKSSLPGLKAAYLLGSYVVYGLVSLHLLRSRKNQRQLTAFWLIVLLGCLGFLISLLLPSWSLRTATLNQEQIYFLGLASMTVILAAIKLVTKNNQGFIMGLDLVFLSLVYAPIAQFLIMGAARLEPVRVLSLATPWMAFWIVVSLANSLRYHTISTTRSLKSITLIPLLTGLSGLVVASRADEPRDMPWYISPSETRILTLADIYKQRNFHIDQLILIASPDLGKLSFAKKGLITDLGWLGDPLLARISKHRGELEALYLNYVAKPDIVQTHQFWSCRYNSWLSSKSFQSNYILADPSMKYLGNSWDKNCVLDGRYAIWTRRPDPNEVALTKQIAILNDPTPAIAKAIEKCIVEGSSPFRCESVVRAIQRNRVKLMRDGMLQRSVLALQRSPSYEMDTSMLLRYPNWGEKAYHSFVALTAQIGADSGGQ